MVKLSNEIGEFLFFESENLSLILSDRRNGTEIAPVFRKIKKDLLTILL